LLINFSYKENNFMVFQRLRLEELEKERLKRELEEAGLVS